MPKYIKKATNDFDLRLALELVAMAKATKWESSGCQETTQETCEPAFGKSFRNEVQMLTNKKHRNFAKLHGFITFPWDDAWCNLSFQCSSISQRHLLNRITCLLHSHLRCLMSLMISLRGLVFLKVRRDEESVPVHFKPFCKSYSLYSYRSSCILTFPLTRAYVSMIKYENLGA